MATYYLSPTGSDSNTGTLVSPWLTVPHAYANSANGDTFVCAAGIFTFVTTYLFNRNIVGASLVGGFPTTIFDGGGSSGSWQMGGDMNINNIMFQNINNSTFVNFPILGYTNNIAVAGTLNLTSVVIRNCIPYAIYGAYNYGGIIGTFSVNGCIFNLHNCLLYDIKQTGSGGIIFAFGSDTSETLNLYNTIIAIIDTSNWANDIFSGGGLTIYIENSAIANFSGGIVYWAHGQTVTQSALTSAFYLLSAGGGGSAVPSGITSDPLFLDPVNGDFNLQQNSPCRGAGTL